MAVWLVRAGAHGEYESKFMVDGRVYATWHELDVDVSTLTDRAALVAAMTERYPDTNPKAISNWSSQVWRFTHEITAGDLIVLPIKSQRTITIGEVTGCYHFEPGGPDPYFHWLPVTWIKEGIPRANFGQDLLNSFGAFMTICAISKNNAEFRLVAMRANGWKPETIPGVLKVTPSPDEASVGSDLEETAQDQIARVIAARFKGHDLTRLVEAILRAQGYTTYVSPEGADGGVDILAGSGPLGFSEPRLCVQVKSESTPIDRPTVDKLLGAMTKFGATEGLFVSWGGFKTTVQKELAISFFRMRLWTQKDMLDQLFLHYEQLDEDLKAELPLKRIWTVAVPDED